MNIVIDENCPDFVKKQLDDTIKQLQDKVVRQEKENEILREQIRLLTIVKEYNC